MKVCFAPSRLEGPRPWVFLAGSIEQGRAEPWQEWVAQQLAPVTGTLLNPRRPEWDASWRQSIDEPKFREQVEWELEALEQSDTIVMYFDPNTKAPITLLELGLFARSGKLHIACPDGYWRKGNVEVVAARYNIPLSADLTTLVSSIQRC